MNGEGEGAQAQQFMQVIQQKVGNLELTLNALLAVLTEDDIVSQEEVNEKAEELVQQIQEQREQQPQE